ncbi:MAG TPA: hypothetical protein VJ756_03250 [Terriglobales bacterium]|nr:hypothetical protein [Terriglobales bacterium]
MNKYRISGIVVIAAHWVTAMWHLSVAAKVLPGPTNGVNLLAVALITLLHLGVAGAWWKLRDKLAGGILSAFFIVALVFGIYEHFIHPGGNNIFMVSASEWKTTFEVSVGLLMALEVLGVGTGIRFLKSGTPVAGVRVAA